MAKNFIFNGPVTNSIIGSTINNGSKTKDSESNNLLLDLIDKAHRITERNSSQVKLEDLHNDDFTHWLRDKGYYTTDQTRSGRSLISVGEVDILVRSNNGTPISIIEAFRLNTCGPNNSVVDKHINKLLNNYDTAGLLQNFTLVYAESAQFKNLWDDYLTYVKSLNIKTNFTTDYKITSFEDISSQYVKVTDIKVGLAKHQRQGNQVVIYHVFINMYR